MEGLERAKSYAAQDDSAFTRFDRSGRGPRGGEAVLLAMVRAVEGLARLEQLEASVPRDLLHACDQARLLVVGEGTEAPSQGRRLLQVLEGREAHDLGRTGLGQRVAVALRGAQPHSLEDVSWRR